MRASLQSKIKIKAGTFLFRPVKMGAGAGVEPTIRRLPDYEPDGLGVIFAGASWRVQQ
jgi:hypothetical protein